MRIPTPALAHMRGQPACTPRLAACSSHALMAPRRRTHACAHATPRMLNLVVAEPSMSVRFVHTRTPGPPPPRPPPSRPSHGQQQRPPLHPPDLGFLSGRGGTLRAVPCAGFARQRCSRTGGGSRTMDISATGTGGGLRCNRLEVVCGVRGVVSVRKLQQARAMEACLLCTSVVCLPSTCTHTHTHTDMQVSCNALEDEAGEAGGGGGGQDKGPTMHTPTNTPTHTCGTPAGACAHHTHTQPHAAATVPASWQGAAARAPGQRLASCAGR